MQFRFYYTNVSQGTKSPENKTIKHDLRVLQCSLNVYKVLLFMCRMLSFRYYLQVLVNIMEEKQYMNSERQ